MDNAIHWINLYSLDNGIGFPNTYLLDSDLSHGGRYLMFEWMGQEKQIYIWNPMITSLIK